MGLGCIRTSKNGISPRSSAISACQCSLFRAKTTNTARLSRSRRRNRNASAPWRQCFCPAFDTSPIARRPKQPSRRPPPDRGCPLMNYNAYEAWDWSGDVKAWMCRLGTGAAGARRRETMGHNDHQINDASARDPAREPQARIDFQTEPARYHHWKFKVDGEVATLVMDVDEKSGLFEGYDLKLNSYDLGVDIELADALERLRFEHPQVRALVIRSAKPRVFSAGANIRMLAGASHAHKVNFCKFTNETRNGIEDLSAHSGLRTICVVNGSAAGGGYELALAADHIMLLDDGSSSVSLPELPLLAVLPGTGGLTRVTDKRKVRRDHADVFCTTEEGIKGKRA